MSSPYPHAWTWIRSGLHLLTGVLVLLVAVRAVQSDEGDRPWQLLSVLLLAGVYLVGMHPGVQRYRRRALCWLAALVVVWLGVLWWVPEGIFFAFPLFFLAAHLLTDRIAVLAVAALTVLAVLGWWAHRGVSVAAVIGPTLGAVVALGTVLGLRAVDRESARRGVLEERERLAREIHDTLAQGFSSINLLLGAAHERLASRIPEAVGPDTRAAAEADAAARLVEEAREVALVNLAEARRFVRALSSPALDGVGLQEALRRAISQESTADLTTTLTLDGDARPLSPTHDQALLRITREALANVRRHAGATRAAVTLTWLADAVALDVVDDGQGFDPEPTTRSTTGFGLASMRSRVAELGGTFTVESAPGSGTALAVVLPVAPPSDQARDQPRVQPGGRDGAAS